jgi:hypothetical protein
MLPTHVVQVQSSEEAKGGGDSGSSSSSGMAYPPKRVQVETTNNEISKSGSSALQSRICGPRGVTSLTVLTQTPIKNEGDIASLRGNGEANGMANKPSASPSRWNTLEFYCYALVFIVAVPYMCRVPMRLSQGRLHLPVTAMQMEILTSHFFARYKSQLLAFQRIATTRLDSRKT